MAGHFPSGRRRLAALCAVAVSAVVLSAPLASAEDDLKDKQKQVERQIEQAHGELEGSSAATAKAARALRGAEASLAAAQGRLDATRVELAAAQQRDVEMQAQLDQAIAALAQARLDLEEGRRQVALQKEAVAELVADIYEQGDPRLIGFAAIAEASDPGDMTRAIAFNESYNDREHSVLEAVEQAEAALAAQEAAVETHKGQIAQARAEAAANLKTRQTLEQQAAAQTAEVQGLVNQRAAAHAAAAAAARADRAVLAGLKKQEQKIIAELRRRAQAAAGSGGNRGGYLSYPVNGPVTSPYGYRTHPIWGDQRLHNGVDFGAPCGAPLYAAADGRVMARGGGDWDPSGNWLYIDHGGVAGVGLSVSYSHAIRYIVGDGQRVKRGQVVGYVGSTGWSTGCHLHFTVKENGNNVDPMKWL